MNHVLCSGIKIKKDILNGSYVVTWNKPFFVEKGNINLFL